jgi:hypothetical protein
MPGNHLNRLVLSQLGGVAAEEELPIDDFRLMIGKSLAGAERIYAIQ